MCHPKRLTISKSTGSGAEVDLDGPGFVLFNLTFNHAALVSVQRGAELFRGRVIR